MTDYTFKRRQFLKGSGLVLGLPFLPSLVARNARAQVAAGKPRLVLMLRTHGATHDNLDVDLSTLDNSQQLYSGHEIKWGSIPARVEGTDRVVSNIVRARSSALTESMVSKMNIFRGLDQPCAMSDHNDWGFGAVGQSKFFDTEGVPSIDQYLAYSASYNAGGAPPVRSINAGQQSFSFRFQNPTTGEGDLNRVSAISDPVALFDYLFPTGQPEAPQMSSRTPLVDRVLDSFRSLRDSNQRISQDDRLRLDAHMEMMLELQRRVQAQSEIAGQCAAPEQPAPGSSGSSASDNIALFQTYNDLVAAAFKCGVSRIATLSPPMMGTMMFTNPGSEWHNPNHQAYKGRTESGVIAQERQAFFEHVFLDLASKLDVEEFGGRTYLDNTFMVYTSDQGIRTHNYYDIMMLTLGSAGSFFKTGNYVDLRNHAISAGQSYRTFDYAPIFPGITMQQFWANVLDSMQVPRQEWAHHAENGGWGRQEILAQPRNRFEVVKGDASRYVTGVRENAGAPLPVVV